MLPLFLMDEGFLHHDLPRGCCLPAPLSNNMPYVEEFFNTDFSPGCSWVFGAVSNRPILFPVSIVFGVYSSSHASPLLSSAGIYRAALFRPLTDSLVRCCNMTFDGLFHRLRDKSDLWSLSPMALGTAFKENDVVAIIPSR